MNDQQMGRLSTAIDNLNEAYADQSKAAQAHVQACQDLKDAVTDLEAATIRYRKKLDAIDVSSLARKSRYLIHLMDSVEQGRPPLRVVPAS